MGLDYTVASKIYHFYQDKTPFVKEGYPNLDKLLSDFKSPGLVFGWLGNEDYACMKMGKYGARYAGGVPGTFRSGSGFPEKPRCTGSPSSGSGDHPTAEQGLCELRLGPPRITS
ncbi:MAG: hypothetical protein U1F87_01005 [Kiritimatiellia bacterium]